MQPHAAWLFPASYGLHLVEEYFAAGGFPAWAQRALGIHLGVGEFVAWNAVAFALMCVGAGLIARDDRFRFIEIALATAVLANAAAHAIGSLTTGTYSPGLLSGAALWVPLGWRRMQAASRAASTRARLAGVCIGALTVVATLAVLAWRADLAR